MQVATALPTATIQVPPVRALGVDAPAAKAEEPSTFCVEPPEPVPEPEPLPEPAQQVSRRRVLAAAAAPKAAVEERQIDEQHPLAVQANGDACLSSRFFS